MAKANQALSAKQKDAIKKIKAKAAESSLKKTIEKAPGKKAAPAKKAPAKKAKKEARSCGFSTRGVCNSSSGGKFWHVQVIGSEMTTTYGKIGKDGQSTTKDFGTEEKATKEAEKLVKQKEKKGYVMEDTPAPAAKAAPAPAAKVAPASKNKAAPAAPPTSGTVKLRGEFSGASFRVQFNAADTGLCVQDFVPSLDNINFFVEEDDDDMMCEPTSCQVARRALDGDDMVSVEFEATIEFDLDAGQLQTFKEQNDMGAIDYHYNYEFKDPNKQGDHDPDDGFFDLFENEHTSICGVEWLDAANGEWVQL